MNDTRQPGARPLMKPIQYAEQRLVISILDGHYPPGALLPGERELAQQLGVTRPTLREALQRLARDRWINVRHGKPTVVNDYWQEGGMGILRTIAEYPRFLPAEFITHLLEVRALFMPVCAQTAVTAARDAFVLLLANAAQPGQSAKSFAEYDRKLQALMVKHSPNRVYQLFFNDYASVLGLLSEGYFTMKKGREASARYYAALADAIRLELDVTQIVRHAMQESIAIWRTYEKKSKKAEKAP